MCLDENPDRARARARPLSPSTNRRPAREVKRADAPRDGSTEDASSRRRCLPTTNIFPAASVSWRIKNRVLLPPRAPFVPPSVPRRSSGREVTLEDAPRDGSRSFPTRCSPRRQTSSRVLPTLGASRRYVEGVSLHLARGGRLPDPSPDSTCRYRSSPRTWSIPSPCCTATPAKEHKVSPLYLRNCSRLYGNA